MRRWLAGLLASALLLVAPLAHAQGWGWTPGTAPIPLPPSVIAVRTGTALQPLVDALPSTGGILQLDPGRFYATLSDTTVALQLNKPVTIVGQSLSGTTIASPVLVSIADCHIEDVRLRPTAGAYAIKFFASGAGVARCSMRHVYVGGDSIGDPAAAVVGIWLDGAILATFDHVTSSYNSGDGLYEVCTQPPLWTTNQNLYLNCSFNGNGGYGVDLAGSGITGTSFFGGNMENNVSGEMNVSNCTEVTVDAVDFERATGVTNVLNFSTTTDARISNCNFTLNNSVTRIIQASTCNNLIMSQNRTSGLIAGRQIGVFDEGSTDCREWNNVYADSSDYIQNRSRVQFGKSQWNSGWQEELSNFRGVLWLPGFGGTGAGLGGAWEINSGTVSRATTTTSDLSTGIRRTIWTRTADNQVMGPTMNADTVCSFWRGDKQYAGGFHFSATFRLDTWGSNAGGGSSTKLFVGMASHAAGLVCSSTDSSGVSGDIVGIYHDAQDKNVVRLLLRDGTTTTKVALDSGSINLASGEAYTVDIWCPSKGGTIYCRVASVNRNAEVAYAQTNGGPLTTTMLGPQVTMGTGTGGACAISVANVYVTR